MKPTARRLLALAPNEKELDIPSLSRTQAVAIIAACESADEELLALRKIDFNQEPIAREQGRASVAEYASWLIDDRQIKCMNGKETMIEVCALWCYDNWKGLIDGVDRVREVARGHGVSITSLRD